MFINHSVVYVCVSVVVQTKKAPQNSWQCLKKLLEKHIFKRWWSWIGGIGLYGGIHVYYGAVFNTVCPPIKKTVNVFQEFFSIQALRSEVLYHTQ